MKNRQKLFLIPSIGFASLLIMACGLTSILPTSKNASPTQPPAGNAQPAQGGQPQPTAADQPTQGALQPAPALSEADVYKALEAASAKMATAGPRHGSLTTTMTFNGKTSEDNGEADIIPPNIHEVLKSDGAVVQEFYVINSDLYSKGDNGWTLKPGGGQAYVDAFNGVSMVEAGDVVRSNGKVAGVELVGGKPALVYTYDSTVKSLKMTSNFTVWVDQASGLMVKMQTMDAKGSKSVMNITYDPGITITLPAEAKSAKTTN